MKLSTQTHFPIPKHHLFLCAVLLLMSSMTSLAETAFTYQGQLSQAGQPADGQYDMTFVLYDADSGGNQVGVTLNEAGIDVSDGVFEVLLDFGDAPFNNAPRWLEIAVREAGGGVYTTLSPRQRVGASPFAIETLFVAPGAVDTAAIQNGAVTEDKIAEQAVTLGKIDNGAVVSNTIANGQVKTVDIDTGAVTRAKIADHAIGTNQVENGSLMNLDVADGGGLLHRKEELQRNVSIAKFISANASSNVVATCADANDIPIAYECRVDTTAHVTVMREVTTYDWDVSTTAASVWCGFQNTHPSLGVYVSAVMICLQVPGP